jgi:hypothetical protein
MRSQAWLCYARRTDVGLGHSRPCRDDRYWRKAVIAAYDALMNGNSNQSRRHIAPGTSSARRPALKPYEPQKLELKIPHVWQASHV